MGEEQSGQPGEQSAQAPERSAEALITKLENYYSEQIS